MIPILPHVPRLINFLAVLTYVHTYMHTLHSIMSRQAKTTNPTILINKVR